MKLITYEIRISHVNGPEHDRWQASNRRVHEQRLADELAYLEASDRYRNVAVQDDD